MKGIGLGQIAEVLGVSVGEVRRTLRAGLDLLGDDAVEVHGELRGRGFVARRASPRKGSRWTFSIETPRQVFRETSAWSEPQAVVAAEEEVRIATLEALVIELNERLAQAEATARSERDLRMQLEGQLATLEARWKSLESLIGHLAAERTGDTVEVAGALPQR